MTRASNPKDNIGVYKAPLSLVPIKALIEESIAYESGKLKYGKTNWRAAPVSASVYLDALLRHAFAYADGEERDEEGTHNLGAVRACAGILLDAAVHGTLIDDRGISGQPRKHLTDAIERVRDLHEKHKDKNPTHYLITGPHVQKQKDTGISE